MENDERMDAAWVARWVVLNYPQESSPSEFKAELRDEPSPTLTEVNEPPPAVSRFRVWFVVDGDNLHRREIPKEETFQGFCSQLKSLYYQTDREFDIDEFEFILIEKRFHRREVAEPFTDADSYYRMVRKLLGIPSHWRHAIVRKKTVSLRCVCQVVANGLTLSLEDTIDTHQVASIGQPIHAKIVNT